MITQRGAGQAIVLAALLLAGCSLAPKPGIAEISGQVRLRTFIPAPSGGILTNAHWLASTNEIVAVYDPPHVGPAETHIYAVGLDGSNLRRLPLPDDLGGCGASAHYSPRPLADGRLAYLRQCYGHLPRVPQEANSLMAYDPRSGANAALFPYYLHANSGQYALAPDGRRGIISDGHTLRQQLMWLLPERTEKLVLPFGRVFSPAWSPDGSRIAFVATPEDGSTGLGRLDKPQHLYVMSADGRDLRRPLGSEVSVGGPEWSPDGRFVVAGMAVQGRAGIWLAEVATGRLWLVSDEKETGGAAFLPDGRTLIVPIGVHSRLPLIPPKMGPAPRVGLLVLELPDLNALPK